MTSSRTPIRLTPHRGPLATPSTSPESSPTSSTPSSGISCCSTNTASSLDSPLLRNRTPTLSQPMQREFASSFHPQRHEILLQGPLSCRAHFSRLRLALRDLVHPAFDLTKTLSMIVTFCLLLFALLELVQNGSELTRQPTPCIMTKQFPLPFPSRTLRCHVDPSLCEPNDQQSAVLQFLSDQVRHAKALSSLNAGVGQPLRTFIEIHRNTISMSRSFVQHNLAELPYFVREGDVLTNLTKLFDASLLDFTSGSFIGRSLTLSLDELSDLMSEPVVLHGSTAHAQHRDTHLHAIYWRITSNLILEYSAARPRARRVLQSVHALHQQLSPFASSSHVGESTNDRSNSWWQDIVWCPGTSAEDRVRALVTGLEITLDNLHRLVAYLDWITERLAQTTLNDVLEIQSNTDLTSCSMLLEELFAQSKPLAPKRLFFNLTDYKMTLSKRPEKVDIMVPGSPTVRAGR